MLQICTSLHVCLDHVLSSNAMPARNRKQVAAVVTLGVASASAAYYVYSK